ncbi:YIP1 family protein [Candidatus Bathyarchaeota archaeon]|nr:YIP1 family protein [Candidatus Bathyarchaeota archaeon]
MSVQDRARSSRFQLRLMWYRMKEASSFSRDGILELRDSETATGQAIAVLVFTALAIGIGSTLQIELQTNTLSVYGILVGVLGNIITGSFAAFVWSGTLFLVGTKLFQGKTEFWQLARPMFFAGSPALLFVLVAVPVQLFYGAVAILAAGWIIALQGFVLKQVMGFDTRRTVLTLAVGFMILLFVYLSFR